MPRSVAVESKILPTAIRAALLEVGYGRADIAVHAAESTTLNGACGDGRKSFVALVNLVDNSHQIIWGSWGGANIGNPDNRVDLDPNNYPIPKNMVVIKGAIGGCQPVYASIQAHPSNFATLLPISINVTDKQKSILRAYWHLKSGSYRQEELQRVGAEASDLDALVSLGLLRRSAN